MNTKLNSPFILIFTFTVKVPSLLICKDNSQADELFLEIWMPGFALTPPPPLVIYRKKLNEFLWER